MSYWCVSCGDRTTKSSEEQPPRKLTHDELQVWASHCYECAMELLFNRVICGPIQPSPRMIVEQDPAFHSAYMSDEASQYQENAIRDMEDRGE